MAENITNNSSQSSAAAAAGSKGLTPDQFKVIGFTQEEANKIERPTISYWQDAWRRLRKNPVAMGALVVLGLLVIMVIIGPHIRGYDYINMNVVEKNQGPSGKYWFGTDSLGRDLFSRVWVGARASVIIALVATALKMVIGTLYGAAMAHFGGWVDDIMMRIIEVINSLPNLLITILIMMILGNNLFALLVALSITAWCNTARQTRGLIKQLKESEYVYAAEVLGASPMRIIIKHYVPNMISILLLDASTAIPNFIFTEAGLSFLGIGLTSPEISLGVLISQGQQTLDFYPTQLLFPCVVLCVIVMAFNLLGDGLRDALDPKLRK
ncbi:MAG: ABC transporter permease [Lachnospiraceae bacterium]